MSRSTRTITVTVCDNCARETTDTAGWVMWWGKDGLNKTHDYREGVQKGWPQKHNCPACQDFGAEMAEVMG